MQRKKRTILIFCILIFFCGIFILILRTNKKDLFAEVYFLNVGQADSILLESQNGRRILIDTGKDSKVLNELSKVLPISDKRIDVVIATHFDSDHIGGLHHVLSRYEVGLFLTTEALSDNKNILEIFNILEKKNIPSFYVRKGMNLILQNDDLFNSEFEIFFPDRNTAGWKTNQSSIIGKFNAQDRSILLTGDSTLSIENFLSKSNLSQKLESDILKLGHHGSKTSTGDIFLSKVKPVISIVSAGVSNTYGHPHQEVVDRLIKNKIEILSTQNGRIHLRTNGKKWQK